MKQWYALHKGRRGAQVQCRCQGTSHERLVRVRLPGNPLIEDRLQITSVSSNSFTPVVKKLTGSGRARPFVLGVRVTIGFDCDNALN
jgi:hypothetical protein